MIQYRKLFAAGLFTCVAAGAAIVAHAADSVPSYLQAALDDSGRPPDDRALDAARMPAQTLAFAMVKPGMKVAVIEPQGDLYYARIFSRLVGPNGHVYLFVPASGYPAQVRGAEQSALKSGKIPPVNPVDAANEILNATEYKNVTVIWQMLYLLGGEFSLPEPINVVWSNGSYNDWHNKAAGQAGKPLPVAAIDKAILDTMAPGGVLYVADKSGAQAFDEASHSADPAAVKSELMAAGFTFDADSSALPGQYVMRFKKPGSMTGDKRPKGSDPLAPYYENTVHGGIGMAVQRWDMYHRDHTYQEYGNTGSRAQQATWYWDAQGNNCHIHEYPAMERSFTDCHEVTPGKKAGDEWTEGEGNATRHYKLEAGATFPPAGGGSLPGAPPVPAAGGGPGGG